MRVKKAFTLIELMIVVIIVAILAASAVPIYRSLVGRSYEPEILSALSTMRNSQRVYYAEKGYYSDTFAALIAADVLSYDDFRDMKYVTCTGSTACDLSISSTTGTPPTAYQVTWTKPTSGDVTAYPYASVDMHEDGTIDRNKT